MDKRELSATLCDGRTLEVNYDSIVVFRDIPFSDSSFYLIVLDPTYLLKVGEYSWLGKKYGVFEKSRSNDMKQGFIECIRVLKRSGTLIFK
ncbi:hypothetical protein [Sporosarcina sp. ANT_H38]|uniref:hypothetical protein n=1 Tax=Sporosarcina sp. ANT_H38 TaxID=2597358 RepID=UPI00351A9CDC